jgi:hypothetical protein
VTTIGGVGKKYSEDKGDEAEVMAPPDRNTDGWSGVAMMR